MEKIRIQIAILALTGISLQFSIGCSGTVDPYSNKFSDGHKVGIVQEQEFAEASGIIASRANPGKYWIINDSGNLPKVYLIDDTASPVFSYWIEGVTNFDWEDIAIYTNPTTGKSTIYVADIGDNYAIRNFVKIIAIEEPDFTVNQDSTLQPVATYFFRYEDGARDAETLLIDPINGDINIISKREENVRVYQTPGVLSEVDTMQLSFVTTLPFHNVVAGDINEDGSEILLKNYNAVFYWQRLENQKLTDVLKQPHEILRYQPEPQGESIAWELDGKGYYTLSERNPPKEQVLYFYERK